MMTMTKTDEDLRNNDDNEHDVPDQRISSPGYVDVKVPQSICSVALGQQSPVSTSSERYSS